MAEKTDEEIIKELGLETSSNEKTSEDVLEELSLDLDEKKEPQIEEIAIEENEIPKSESKDNTLNSEESNNEDIENTTFDDEEPSMQKKQPKIMRILIAVVSFLFGLLLIGLVLFFSGFFDQEEDTKVMKPQVQKIVPNTKKEKVNLKEINKTRLNNKLKNLTKKEILDQEELEAQKRKVEEEKKKKEEAKRKALEDMQKKEEARIAKEKAQLEEEKKLFEEHKQAIRKEKEDFLKLQETAKLELEKKKEELLQEFESKKTMPKEDEQTTQAINNQEVDDSQIDNKDTMQEDEVMKEDKEPMTDTSEELKSTFLLYINVTTIEGDLLKADLDKIERFGKKVSLCRDNKNRIEVYLGPYDSNKEREKVFDNLLVNDYKDAYLVGFTKEEYKKRCEY